MRIASKLTLGAVFPVLLIWGLGLHSTKSGQTSLRDAIERASAARTVALMDEIDRLIASRILEWRSYSRHPLMQETLLASNARFEELPDPEAWIDEAEQAWRAAPTEQPTALMRELEQNPLAADLRARLAELEREIGHSVFGEVFVTNSLGANVAQTHRTSDFRQNDEEWWESARHESVFVSDVGFDESAGIYSCDICLRIDDSSGRFRGVLKAVLDIQEVIALMEERAGSDANGSATSHSLFTSDGRIVHSTSRDVEPLADGMAYLDGVAFAPRESVVTVERDDPESGAPMLVAIARSQGFGAFRGLGWMLISERAADEAFASVSALRRRILMAAGAATLATVLALGLLAFSLSRRMGLLTDAVVAMRKGHLDQRVAVTGHDELGQLGTCFNEMAASLERASQELEERARTLAGKNEDLEREIEMRRQTERELVVATERAETAARLKGEFLANMSHELRTPLNGVIGTVELALETELNAAQQDLLETSKTSAELLLSVINDILDFSKIEAGKLDLVDEEFDLRATIGETLRSLAPVADTKGIELTFEVLPRVPAWVVGDSNRFRQVVVNLVGNALKFTSEGEVGLRVSLQAATESGVELHVSVRDTGIGISDKKKDLIFEAFAQADGSITRVHGGTGLGLSISSQLVRLMGGKIWLESRLGEGSTFHFTVAFARSSRVDDASEEVVELEGLRVLVVDDNATNRRILDGALGRWKMQVTCVDGGPAALVAVDAANASGRPYELVLLDAMMPGMDGFEVAAAVRDRDGAARPVVMMLSSSAAMSDAERCRSLGISRYLTKPVLNNALRRAIVSSVRRETVVRAAPSEPQAAPPRGAGQRVLLVEDNPLNQKVAARMLESHGYSVEVAGGGPAALEVLGRESFDVILMDVQMPTMDGFEVTARIRANERHSGTHIPIVALTAHALTGFRERCIAAGMDDYLAKPVRARELRETLAKILAGGDPPSADAES